MAQRRRGRLRGERRLITFSIALGVIVLGVRGALRVRDRYVAARGCPHCRGPLTGGRGSVYGCRACRVLWTTSGLELVFLKEVPVDLLPLSDEVPRAQLRQRSDE